MKQAMVAVAIAFCACGGDPQREQTVQGLEGTWLATCFQQPPDMSGQVSYARPQFTYAEGGKGAFEYTIYGDAACTFKLATFLAESDVTVGSELPAVAKGAYELNVTYRKLSATPFVDGFAQGFQQAGCGSAAWQTGVSQDISTTGCFSFKPISKCPGDYDLARVDGDRFFNGARETDMCVPAGRPKKLAEYPLARVK